MKNTLPALNMMVFAVMITVAGFFTANPAKAGHDKNSLAPEMVEEADRFLAPRFDTIGEYCDQGLLPWSMAAKDTVKLFLNMLYKHNGIVGAFNIRGMRVYAAFSDSVMEKFLSIKVTRYSPDNFHNFFYNMNRCRYESKHAAKIFSNIRYILNHHYSEIDTCLTTYHSDYENCAFSLGFRPSHDGPIIKDFISLYETANALNRFNRQYNVQEIWLGQLQNIGFRQQPWRNLARSISKEICQLRMLYSYWAM